MEELASCTWDTLSIYLGLRIAGAQQFLRDIRRDLPAADADYVEADYQRVLNPLHWLVPFVDKMQNRPALQSLHPWLSLQTVRLFCPDSDHEFAWIDAIADGRFGLQRVTWKGNLKWDTHPICEGSAEQVADEVTKLLISTCAPYSINGCTCDLTLKALLGPRASILQIGRRWFLPDKVFAYITHGTNLLVFSHPDFPEAGIQVPAGTIEAGEAPEAAVMREAFEETGLTGLTMRGFLGACNYDMYAWGGDPAQHRYFFHLELQGDAPTTWRHSETDGGVPEPIVFEFFWARLPGEVPELIAGHGQMLDALIARQYKFA